MSSGTTFPDAMKYKRLVGQLIYLTITRPDISYHVHILSQFMTSPTNIHWQAALKLVIYIKENPRQCFFLSASSSLTLKSFYNTDWEKCPI